MTTAVSPVLLPARRAAWVTPAVIFLLLVLRLVMVGLGGWLLDPRPEWLGPVFETGTYLLTLFLIFWERDRLEEFHIGWLAVGIILIFKPLETLQLRVMGYPGTFPMAFPSPYALLVWAGALVTLVWLFAARPQLRKSSPADWRWFGLGMLVGILTALAIALPMSLQLRQEDMMVDFRPGILSHIVMPFISQFPYQLGYAAVSEEPLFRGFLWGWLRQRGWQHRWIWLFQTGLFMLGHIYYIVRAPYSFWIIVPLGALVTGWLAWRSRSIATSMAAHGALNALGMPIGQAVAYWLFR